MAVGGIRMYYLNTTLGSFAIPCALWSDSGTNSIPANTPISSDVPSSARRNPNIIFNCGDFFFIGASGNKYLCHYDGQQYTNIYSNETATTGRLNFMSCTADNRWAQMGIQCLRQRQDGSIHFGGFYLDYYSSDSAYTLIALTHPSSGHLGGFTVRRNTAISVSNGITSVELDDICAGGSWDYIFPDPYEPGGYSSPDPGGGSFDDVTDVVPIPDLPTFSFSDSGFTRIYNPNEAQLRSLSRYLWTDQTFLNTVINHAKQLLENPIDAIIALNLLPCSVPNGTDEEVKVMFIPTGVTMPPVTNQFVSVDCGSAEIDEYYGSALDYSPYTTIELVLPFIGQVSLDTDEVMGHVLHVRYRVDVVTGMCLAIVSVDGIEGGEPVENVLYQFTGHCAISMPITSADFSSYVAAAIGAAKTGAAVAMGSAAGAVASHNEAILNALRSPGGALDSDMPVTDDMKKFETGIEDAAKSARATEANYSELMCDNFSNTVASVMSSKPVVQHSGGFTGNSGYLGVRRPYLIIKRPRMCNPEEYGKYNGRPAMMYMKLGDLRGYTQVQQIQLTGIPATNPELGEISTLLKGGVIL